MTFKLGPDAEKMIEDQLRTRRYTSPEAVILAGLKSLASRGPEDFAPGEIDALLADGERSIAAEGTVDGDEALAARRQRRRTPGSGAA